MSTISKYPSAYSKEPTTVFLHEELQKFKLGHYKSQIQKCRNAIMVGDLDHYKSIKSTLPAVTFSGVFQGAHKKENLQTYNNVVIVDVDNISPDLIEEKKKLVYSDEFVIACWKSPSDLGLKFLVKVSTTPTYHKYAFDAVSAYFTEKYGLNIDRSGSDVCRLCYVSFDPDLLLKDTYSTFQFSINLDVPNAQSATSKGPSKAVQIEQNEKVLFFQTENRNRKQDREIIGLIIKYLSKNKFSITSIYTDWIKTAFAISNTFTHDLGEKYFLALCELDGAKHDEYKSKSLLEYCYRNRRQGEVNFGTIIYQATEKGFILKSKVKS